MQSTALVSGICKSAGGTGRPVQWLFGHCPREKPFFSAWLPLARLKDGERRMEDVRLISLLKQTFNLSRLTWFHIQFILFHKIQFCSGLFPAAASAVEQV